MKGHAMNDQLAKCSCSHCGGHLELEPAMVGLPELTFAPSCAALI